MLLRELEALTISREQMLDIEDDALPPAVDPTWLQAIMPFSSSASFEDVTDRIADVETDVCDLVDVLEDNVCVSSALLAAAPSCEQNQTDPDGETFIRVTLEHPSAHAQPVDVQVDLGQPDGRTVRLTPQEGSIDILVPAGQHKIDVRPINPANGRPTFQVLEGGTVRTQPQASPYLVTVPNTGYVQVFVNDPLATGPIPPVSLPNGGPGANVTITVTNGPGSPFFPYQVQIFDASTNQQVKLYESQPNGQAPVIAAGNETIPPGNYKVRVRPVRLHYPTPWSLQILGGGQASPVVRSTNHDDIPVNVIAGQTIAITAEPGIESYNQDSVSLNGVDLLLIFNRPYLHFQNERLSPVPTLAPDEATPNNLLEHMSPGATAIVRDLSTTAAIGIIAQAGQANPTWEFRSHHVTLLISRNAQGDIPVTLTSMTEMELTTALQGALQQAYDNVMSKPYRTSDAMSIHALMRIEEVPFMNQADRAIYEPRVRPAGEEVHMNKLDAIALFGTFYMDRWSSRRP